ncbi:MAG: right-handed parallel beta-helix repeat-containing protein [Anaerolineales bacterium]|nr:right-handed parallel beta-helix repeat-containing protein [Anaerolineales bacterium]MCB9128464.1 right-handed parallel beta-helix repeat-containing protein [Ardenticatenales bacterium]
MSGSRIIFTILILCLLLMSGGQHSVAAVPDELITFTVNIGADMQDANPGDGICSAIVGLTFCTLRAAIEEANAGSEAALINFAVPNPASFQLSNGQLSILNDLTIQGDGTDQLSILGHDANRVFNIVGAGDIHPTVTIKDLTIAGGGAAGDQNGAGIRVLSSTVMLERVNLEDNGVDAGCGGAFYLNESSTVMVQDAVVQHNETAQGHGAAFCSEGGTLTIESSEISENFGTGVQSSGGAIYSEGGSLLVQDSVIWGNEVSFSGGGIHVVDSAVTIVGSELIDNQATMGGAFNGVNVEPLQVEHSLFENNAALDSGPGGGIRILGGSNATIVQSYFSNNQSEGNGGAIYSSGSVLDVSDSTFFMNRSYNHFGGAIFATGQLSVANSTLSGNWGMGGAITLQSASSVGHLLHSTLALNFANNSGAAINVHDGAALTVENSILAPNTASSGNDNCATIGGGTIIASGGNLASDDSCPGFSLPNQDPQLLPLDDNGGPTFTHMPNALSPALDVASEAGCAAVAFFDQRGYGRVDGNCDLGAVERNGVEIMALYLPLIEK